jgi:hypothetical protein
MATIHEYNDILRRRGAKDAVEFAVVSREPVLLRAARKTVQGLWILDDKRVPACPGLSVPDELPAMARQPQDFRDHRTAPSPAPKPTKTALGTGKAASDKRKRDRSAADMKIRAKMKGAGSKKS